MIETLSNCYQGYQAKWLCDLSRVITRLILDMLFSYILLGLHQLVERENHRVLLPQHQDPSLAAWLALHDGGFQGLAPRLYHLTT